MHTLKKIFSQSCLKTDNKDNLSDRKKALFMSFINSIISSYYKRYRV